MKIRVGVVFGGRSVEHEVAVISALQTIRAIDRNQYSVVPIYISKQGIWYSGDALLEMSNYKNMDSLLQQCRPVVLSPNTGDHHLITYRQGLFQKNITEEIDVAFPVMHGAHGEDGCLQGFFELMDIPYVGPNVLAAAAGMDKIAMKAMFRAAGLPVVRDCWFYTSEWLAGQETVIRRVEAEMAYPVIVKPANLGSSIGITKAADREQLVDAIELARSFSLRILVEEMIIDLREVNCAVLGDHESQQPSVCEEPISAGAFLSFQDKYLSGGSGKGMSSTKRRIPADISPKMTTEIQEMACQAFKALDCAGVCRMDFLVDQSSGRVCINEANTIPGSLSFYLWEAAGKTFTQLTTDLIKLALKRQREKEQLLFSYDSNILAGHGGFKGKK